MTKKELCEFLGKQRFLAEMTYDRISKVTSLIELVKSNIDDSEEETLTDTLSIAITYLLDVMEDLEIQQYECKEEIGKLSEEIVKEQLDAKQ